jgi:hypothetical protein
MVEMDMAVDMVVDVAVAVVDTSLSHDERFAWAIGIAGH